jgi:hypothetical protein
MLFPAISLDLARRSIIIVEDTFEEDLFLYLLNAPGTGVDGGRSRDHIKFRHAIQKWLI